MNLKRLVWVTLICAAAAAANYFLNLLTVYVLKLPLFLDTVFSCALAFAEGLVPGLIVALLSWLANGIREGGFPHWFILCSMAEVVLVCLLKPKTEGPETGNAYGGAARASLYRDFAGLFVLYIAAALIVSVLGGLIDFVQTTVLSFPKSFFSAEDTFKIGLARSNIPALAADILSRIPVNIVDRFITIFGGYFAAQGIRRLRALMRT